MRTLKIWFCFITIAVIALVAVQPVQAQGLSWSSGISLTESKDSAYLGARIDAFRGNRLLGTWFSSSSQLPQAVQGVGLVAYGDFTGIKKVERVVLSPDHGLTQWDAVLEEGKGYAVDLPEMPAGGYALEWGVYSKDKHNRLLLIIIPINWSSGRTTSVLNHFMVQSAPAGCNEWNNQMWFSCLRGFVSSIATPDMGYLAQQQAVVQMSQPQPQSSVPSTPEKEVEDVAPAAMEEISAPEPEPIPVTRPRMEPMEERQPSEVRIVFQGRQHGTKLASITVKLEKDQRIRFASNGRETARGTVVRKYIPGNASLVINITSGRVGWSDRIEILGGKK